MIIRVTPTTASPRAPTPSPAQSGFAVGKEIMGIIAAGVEVEKSKSNGINTQWPETDYCPARRCADHETFDRSTLTRRARRASDESHETYAGLLLQGAEGPQRQRRPGRADDVRGHHLQVHERRRRRDVPGGAGALPPAVPRRVDAVERTRSHDGRDAGTAATAPMQSPRANS